MIERLSTVNRKGQVTIPIEIRRALGLREGHKISFVLDGGLLESRPIKRVVEATAGAFKGKGPILTAEQLREAAERAIGDAVIERSGG